jgi:hypothetical protein
MMRSDDRAALRRAAFAVTRLEVSRAQGVRVIVDVDPVQLL